MIRLQRDPCPPHPTPFPSGEREEAHGSLLATHGPMTLPDCRDTPLTSQTICATMRRMKLVAEAEPCASEPLSGGVSSDIWKVEAGGRRYCLKRALPRLKVAQLWEAPIARNAFEWEWLKLAERPSRFKDSGSAERANTAGLKGRLKFTTHR